MSRPHGYKVTEATKKKIGEAQVARFLERVENPPERPSTKQCSVCLTVKPIAAFYQKKKYRPVSEVTVFYPTQPCKRCKAAQDKARLERLAAEGKSRKRKKPESTAHSRRVNRERLTARRRKLGMKPRNFTKPHERETTPTHRLPAAPIKKLLERELETRTIRAISQATGIGERRINGIVRDEHSTLRLETVDDLLHGLGMPEEMQFLYPDTSTGWHYVKGKI